SGTGRSQSGRIVPQGLGPQTLMKGAGPTASAQGDVVGAAMTMARGLKSRRTYAIKSSPQGRLRLGCELTLPSPDEIEARGPGRKLGLITPGAKGEIR